MDVNVLIDSLVRQTTILIAQLATSMGARAPLAHVANQVFLDLTQELRRQGLGQKVIADMFGLALRTYHAKVRRLAESNTYAGRSLWEAVLSHLKENGILQRAEVLTRFRNDDPAVVRAVLRDLVDSGIVFASGRSDATTYRVASPEEYPRPDLESGREALVNLVWVGLNRYAPATSETLSTSIPLERALVEDALAELVRDGRARSVDAERGLYDCMGCVIPLGSTAGWEAAVFDHFQTMVTALCTKLGSGNRIASKDDWVGGSTYGFDVWPGHPHRDEVLGFLRSVREQAVRLRKKVDAYNLEHGVPEDSERVLAYAGQTVLGLDDEGDEA